MDRFERWRKRLHLLLTKGGKLTSSEKGLILHLENMLTAPATNV